jgi:hypothetical protein
MAKIELSFFGDPQTFSPEVIGLLVRALDSRRSALSRDRSLASGRAKNPMETARKARQEGARSLRLLIEASELYNSQQLHSDD